MNEPAWQGLRDQLADEFDEAPFMIETQVEAQNRYPGPGDGPLADAFEKGAAWALAQPPTTAETEHAARTIATSRHEPHWAASRVIHDLQSGRSPRHPERD